MDPRRRVSLALTLALAVAGLTLTACNGATDQVAANAAQPTISTPASTGGKQPSQTKGSHKAAATKTAANKPAASSAGIEILNFQFLNLTAKAGQVTKVANKDTAPHSLTADNRAFDTGILAGGSSGTFTAPSVPGTYKIHCDVHPFMTGTLQVS